MAATRRLCWPDGGARTRIGAFAVACAMLTAAFALSGCVPPLPPNATPIPPEAAKLATAPPAADLGKVEVQEYRGKRLDAIASERENSIKGVQNVDIRTYRLKIGGHVESPQSLAYSEIASMPAYQKVTTLNCIEGWSVTYLWRGVRIKDLLEKAGYDRNAKLVIFRGHDGYSTSLPLDYIVKRDILLAYSMNGVEMPAERGFPFQVVAEDQFGYKWAKWVTGIEVSNDTSFRGYWEQRGYDNTASVTGAR